MNASLALMILACIAQFGCATGKVSTVDEVHQVAVDRKMGVADAIAVVDVSGTTRAARDCIEGELRTALKNAAIIPSDRFQDAFFPWLEPNVTPDDTESLLKLMGQPLVRRRLHELGVRYIVALRGGTTHEGHTWGGAVYGPGAGIIVGGAHERFQTLLGARILDLQRIQSVAQVEAEGKGEFAAGMLVIIPYAYGKSSVKAACATIAQRVAAYFTGTPQGLPEPVETKKGPSER
jgi:hypothetical protein